MKLKKAANILFLVGAIVSIVFGVSYLIGGIVTTVLSVSPEIKDMFVQAAQQADPQASAETTEGAYLLLQASLISSSVCCFIFGAFCIPSCIFSFKARNNNVKTFFILNIVFGILSWSTVNVVGAVFALIKGDTIVEEPAPQVEVKE